LYALSKSASTAEGIELRSLSGRVRTLRLSYPQAQDRYLKVILLLTLQLMTKHIGQVSSVGN